jgi:hypothetical protein
MKSKKLNSTQPEKNRVKPKKPSQIDLNRFFFQNNRTETGWFEQVSVRFWFFFQNLKTDFVIFFYKNQTESKMIIPTGDILSVILKTTLAISFPVHDN